MTISRSAIACDGASGRLAATSLRKAGNWSASIAISFSRAASRTAGSRWVKSAQARAIASPAGRVSARRAASAGREVGDAASADSGRVSGGTSGQGRGKTGEKSD